MHNGFQHQTVVLLNVEETNILERCPGDDSEPFIKDPILLKSSCTHLLVSL